MRRYQAWKKKRIKLTSWGHVFINIDAPLHDIVHHNETDISCDVNNKSYK